MSARGPTKTVFVGNLPFGMTDEMLAELMAEFGPVRASRLATDKDTGKVKGYGFCEYYDVDTAIAAVRGVDGRPLGGRNLRASFADDSANPAGGPGVRMGAPPPGAVVGHQRAAVPTGAVAALATAGPPPPAPWEGGGGGPHPGGPPVGAAAAAAAAAGAAALLGAPPPAPGSAGDAVSAALARASRGQLVAVAGQLQDVARRDRATARALLVAHPQLAVALFQTQVMLGLVTPPAGGGGGGGPPPPPPGPPPHYGAPPPPPPSAHYPPAGPSPQHPYGAAPPMPPQAQAQPVYAPADPRDPRAAAYAPPPPGPPPPPPPGAGPDSDQAQAMLAQVMSLTEEQVAALPAEHRAQVLALREHVRRTGGR